MKSALVAVCEHTLSREISGRDGCAVYKLSDKFGTGHCNKHCLLYNRAFISCRDSRARAWKERKQKKKCGKC